MILVLAGGVAVVAFLLLWKELAARSRPRKLSKVAAFAAVMLIAALVMLTATGRLHWIAAVGAAALPLLRWVFGLMIGPVIGRVFQAGVGGLFQGRGAPRQPTGAARAGGERPAPSTVATSELRMTLDHETGRMDGEVLAGPYQGARLSDLDLDKLKTVLGALKEADSQQLLVAYLERRFPDWAETVEERPPPPSSSGHDMQRQQALEVLGLDDDADEQAIVTAHRRLMQKLHPDRGGSDYLAATLNRAKDVLLEES